MQRSLGQLRAQCPHVRQEALGLLRTGTQLGGDTVAKRGFHMPRPDFRAERQHVHEELRVKEPHLHATHVADDVVGQGRAQLCLHRTEVVLAHGVQLKVRLQAEGRAAARVRGVERQPQGPQHGLRLRHGILGLGQYLAVARVGDAVGNGVDAAP